MQTVEVSRVVAADPTAVEEALAPDRVVSYEGGFTPERTTVREGMTVVTARPSGRLTAVRFVFDAGADALTYRRNGVGGGVLAVETTITTGPAEEGTRVRIRSTVSTRFPIPFAERVAAWGRRRTLTRMLDALAAAVA